MHPGDNRLNEPDRKFINSNGTHKCIFKHKPPGVLDTVWECPDCHAIWVCCQGEPNKRWSTTRLEPVESIYKVVHRSFQTDDGLVYTSSLVRAYSREGAMEKFNKLVLSHREHPYCWETVTLGDVTLAEIL